ncbi:hypothetical protein MBLNU230_g7527t1 [Neophaeotheca triangularis]
MNDLPNSTTAAATPSSSALPTPMDAQVSATATRMSKLKLADTETSNMGGAGANNPSTSNNDDNKTTKSGKFPGQKVHSRPLGGVKDGTLVADHIDYKLFRAVRPGKDTILAFDEKGEVRAYVTDLGPLTQAMANMGNKKQALPAAIDTGDRTDDSMLDQGDEDVDVEGREHDYGEGDDEDPQGAGEEEEREELHCICRMPEHGEYRQCDYCGKKYHDTCLNLQEVDITHYTKEGVEFHCPLCTAQRDPVEKANLEGRAWDQAYVSRLKFLASQDAKDSRQKLHTAQEQKARCKKRKMGDSYIEPDVDESKVRKSTHHMKLRKKT